MTDVMALEIPVDAGFAVTARAFVVTAARSLGLAEGRVDDLRLATSELVANAVEAGHHGPIRLSLHADEGDVVLDASGVGDITDDQPISRRALLESLFTAERIVMGATVGIRVPLDEPAVLDRD